MPLTSSTTSFFSILISIILISAYSTGHSSASNFVDSVQSTIQASRQAISVIESQRGITPSNGDSDEDTDLSNALHDCTELLDDSIDHLRASINDPFGVQCNEISSTPCTSISAALDNHEICMEGLDIRTNNITIKERVIAAVNPLKSMMTQLLTMADSQSNLSNYLTKNKQTIWLGKFDIMNPPPPNVTVALDGTGDYKSIMAAVNAAPINSNNRFVILVKTGVYEEYVKILRNKPNIVLIGEGRDMTIIKGSRSYTSGYKTYHTATIVVSGCGFMARDITFENTAGPEGRQAVAMRSNANNLVFYHCAFRGYQDTLYARSGRQFFRECEIEGTVDFIFGDAAAIFQYCKILVRKPMKGQFNTVTAQGRAVGCSETGFSFHGCAFIAKEQMEETRTYMGRPWKTHSRTVVMKSYLDELIHKQGWEDWDNRSTLDTIYYGEYMNRGSGANVDGRVKWPGFHVIVNEGEAMDFTVGRFIHGDEWLPSTGVIYVSGIRDGYY